MDHEILDEDFQHQQPKEHFDAETTKKINFLKWRANQDVKNIKYGRIALWVLLIFQVIGIISGLLMQSPHVRITGALVEGVVLFGIYAACIIGVRHNPRVALLTGLLLFLILQFLNAMIDASNIYQAILMKIVLLYFLTAALRSAFRLKSRIRELSSMGVSTEELEQLSMLKTVGLTLRKK